jgi:hypothetical protein
MGNSLPVSAAALDRFATEVADALPAVAARIPATPAAALGRRSAAEGGVDPDDPDDPTAGARTASRRSARSESRVFTALRALGPLLAERLLGALELSGDGIVVDLPTGAADWLATPDRTGIRGAFVSGSGDSETIRAVTLVDAGRPGATDLIVELAETLRRHDTVAPLLTEETSGPADEATIAARHGTVHLALTMVVAAAVARALNYPVIRSAPAVVGMALGAAAVILADAPMPAAYADAQLAARQAKYLYPHVMSGSAEVTGHQFALAEGPVPADETDFAANGLVASVTGGAVIRTGAAQGQVRVALRVLAEPPTQVALAGWDEVVEISWTARTGSATVSGTPRVGRPRSAATPPWPGGYRVRVHAQGRDGDDAEQYELIVWSAPAAPQLVHKQTDALGHRLRGEPEPVREVAADAAYWWIEYSWVEMAATITVVTGLSAEEVLRAFGADPASTESLVDTSPGVEPMVAVLPIDGAVLAVEDNGWRATDAGVLRRLSARGRAASMYWNVNGLTRLSFARDGELLAGFELGEPVDPSDLSDVLAGLDFTDYRHGDAKGLTAVARFTGHDFGPEHLDRIRAADVVYPITVD